ncbi:TrmH family RNA methyltransferase [Patescibacteria group bacterium]|nr:TrmH family RNA methyltransferase [Patescibacteria group bacterium]
MKIKELVVIAHNIRSMHNVGSIFRTAEGAGVAKLYLTGYTPFPPRPEIAKVALGSEKRLQWVKIKRVGDLIRDLKKSGYLIVALEQDGRAVDYRKFKPTKSKIALIIGNEVRGVSQPLRIISDVIIEIPMRGQRKSLNVSVAFGVAIYQLSNWLG